ncbi:Uu.00g045340.m01.CDS01 [Anthostomella pinea]|uniref:Uu.00g045340.m01.CDS01 n=1 Tax=Anthostomella pinea TaxID=933095 RepID=A0AAI8VB61_9PEZI|nr:Uu.00g045340.m01.CDS01 [Anthostomella pinea]
MTRYPPTGPGQEGDIQGRGDNQGRGDYQGSSSAYGSQQPNEPDWRNYNSGEGQARGYQQQPSQPQRGSYGQGAAQSYYPGGQGYQQQQPQRGSYGQGVGQGYYGSNFPAYYYRRDPNQGDASGIPYYPGGLHQTPPGPGASQLPAYGQQQQYSPPQQAPASSYGGGQYSPPDWAAYGHWPQPYVPIPTAGQPLPPGGAEADRGLMGAVAGGAAGAYGGHRMGHGIMGGIGGAVAGSILEDALKQHNKKDKKPKQRRGSNSSSSSSSSSSCDDDEKRVMAGNFSASLDVRMEGRCTLVAECFDVEGRRHTSHLDLNECLTNNGGRLQWLKGGNFAASARTITLTDGGAVLVADLGDGRGGWNYVKVLLNERITNDNGRLHMLCAL